MRGINKSLAWAIAAICLMAVQSAAIAQDDLYYDPSASPTQTTRVTTTTTYTDEPNEPGNLTRRYDDNDQNYSDEDDYAYEYSSRIRRFHRPVQVVDYYDPFFVDLYNYDPFFLPGASIYTAGYNDYWTWRRWQRWNRWNRWNSFDYGWGCNAWGGNGWGGNGWGWNNGWGNNGWNSWNNINVFNNYYYDPYWTANGYNPYYNGPWVNNNYIYDNGNNGNNNGNGYQPQTYTGPRRRGTAVNPGYARLSGNSRLSPPVKDVPTIDMKTRQNGRTSVDNVPGASDRDAIGGRQVSKEVPTGSGRVPNVSGEPKSTTSGREAEISRRLETPPNNGRDVRPSRNTDENTPSRRTEPSTTRPSRGNNQDATPSRRSEPSIERPSRPSRNNQESTPTRRSEPNYDRPSRSGNEDATPSRRSESSRATESRPSRSESSGRSFESSGSSSRSSGSGSSGKSSGGGSSRSSGSGSSRGGRN